MSIDEEKFSAILRLLAANSSLSVVRAFLKDRELPYSAPSWNDLAETRLRPALKSGHLSEGDLLRLLQDAEEFGRQHVFLFGLSRRSARLLTIEDHIENLAHEVGLDSVLNSNAVLDEPGELQIADMRIEPGSRNNAALLVLKLVGSIRRWERIQDEIEQDGTRVIRYSPIVERAVNVIRVHGDGIVEIRIHSHRSSSSYIEELDQIMETAEPILPVSKMSQVSLSKAKERLWSDRKSLSKLIRYSDSELRNDLGTTLTAATGSKEDDLPDDAAAISSVQSFYKSNGYFSASNIWFLKNPNKLSRDVHVRLAGELNEFAVPAQCVRGDYEHVLSEILRLNKQIP